MGAWCHSDSVWSSIVVAQHIPRVGLFKTNEVDKVNQRRRGHMTTKGAGGRPWCSLTVDLRIDSTVCIVVLTGANIHAELRTALISLQVNILFQHVPYFIFHPRDLPSIYYVSR